MRVEGWMEGKRKMGGRGRQRGGFRTARAWKSPRGFASLHPHLGKLVHVVVADVHVQAVGLPTELVEREEEAAQDWNRERERGEDRLRYVLLAPTSWAARENDRTHTKKRGGSVGMGDAANLSPHRRTTPSA